MPEAIEKYLTRRQVIEFLENRGYPLSWSTLSKLAMRGEGPPLAGVWGNRHLYKPADVLAWARQRFHSTARAA